MGTLTKLFNSFINAVAEEINNADKNNKPSEKPVKKYYTVDTYNPRNYIESAIQSLANSAKSSVTSSYKMDCCRDIMKVLKSNWTDISGTTKSYAIAQLKSIANSTCISEIKVYINDCITKIAVGDL